MSRLYDAAEPGVIDEDLLRQLVVDQGPQKEAGRIARAEGISFDEVLHLRLDFKSEFSGLHPSTVPTYFT